jgi:molybdenum cofactor cytidylyltransferase
MIDVIILAAGMSRRMGAENKLLLPFGGSTILETTLNNILKADIGKVYAVIGHESDKIEAVLNKIRNIIIVKNPDYAQGMLTSIQAGVRAISDFRFRISASDNTKINTQKPKLTEGGVMICLSDMPLILPEEYRLLAQSFHHSFEKDKKTIVQPIYKGVRGNPVIFSSVYSDAILNLSVTEDAKGCRPIVQVNKQHLRLIEMPASSILNDIDTKEDYEKLAKY